MQIDLLLKNGYVYQTYRQCFEKKDIAVSGEMFYHISPVLSYEAKEVVDCTGTYIIPGLVDIHMHVESSMTYPVEFSRVVLPYGVTTVVSDPHEIANVFGIEGVKAFLKQETVQDIFYAIPSSVPSTNQRLETSGAVVEESEAELLLHDPRVICLGEVMNFRDLVSEEDTTIKRLIRLCKERNRHLRIEGHCPSLTGEDLARFIFAGVDADHTQQTPESVLEKVDLGMFLELQRKSLTKEVMEVVNRFRLYESVALVTDDTMPDHLLKGQLNMILKHAVSVGMPVEQAIYCSTYTPSRRMKLDDRGVIAPGKLADFVIYDDLESWTPAAVYKNGRRYHEEMLQDEAAKFPPHFYQSVNCRPAMPEDFVIQAEMETGFVEASVIQIAEFGNATKAVSRRLRVEHGEVCWKEAGLCLAAVFERYGKNGNVGYGLVAGALKEDGAVATTWSHDSHNLFVLGNSPEDMAAAQREVLTMQGGYVACVDGRTAAKASLQIGGILHDGPLEELAEEIGAVRRVIEGLGYVNNNVIMSISTLSLLVSPVLKLSDKGLVEVKTQEFVSLIQNS